MEVVNVLSFGAGVQSSALIIAADRGDIGPRPDFAVFADTKSEPKEVYDWLDKVQQSVSIPIVIASRGSLEVDQIEQSLDPSYPGVASIPAYMLNRDGSKGMLWRTCTDKYKIQVVKKAIRSKLGYTKGQRWKHKINMIMGISTDEIQRMKVSKEPWVEYVYPLIDNNWHRQNCIEYVQKTGIGTPPRSACYFCPFKSNSEWRRLRDESPEYWQKAISFDYAIRSHPDLDGKRFLHAQRKPLDQVDLEPKQPTETQLSFDDECAGICGV